MKKEKRPAKPAVSKLSRFNLDGLTLQVQGQTMTIVQADAPYKMRVRKFRPENTDGYVKYSRHYLKNMFGDSETAQNVIDTFAGKTHDVWIQLEKK